MAEFKRKYETWNCASYEQIIKMFQEMMKHRIPPLKCRDCGAEFYLFNMGRYSPLQEIEILRDEYPLYCFNHINQEVAIKFIGSVILN